MQSSQEIGRKSLIEVTTEYTFVMSSHPSTFATPTKGESLRTEMMNMGQTVMEARKMFVDLEVSVSTIQSCMIHISYNV